MAVKENRVVAETTDRIGQLNNLLPILLQCVSGSAGGYPEAGTKVFA